MALSVRRACSAGVGGIDPWTDSGGGCAWIGGYAVPSADAALSLLPSSPSAKLLARPFSTAATSGHLGVTLRPLQSQPDAVKWH